MKLNEAYKNMVFEARSEEYIGYFEFQDNNQEQIIHSVWDKGNVFRYVLEGSGDIFREFTKSEYSIGYIMEKIRRIKEFLQKSIKGTIHEEDSFETCKKYNRDKLLKLKELWEKQPYDRKNDKQLTAIVINEELLNRKFTFVLALVEDLEKELREEL